LSVNFGSFVPTAGQTFAIIDAGLNSVSGIFSGLANHSRVASCSGVNVDIDYTSVPGHVILTTVGANSIAVTSGSGQSATVNTNFGSALVATVSDQFGNPVSGVSVTFAAPGSGAS